ncbi:MAG TPA: hypothetical protein VM659_01665 [Dongiaceae bacterium]|nr:hypothetical protein [Dongiaceae bacterium]
MGRSANDNQASASPAAQEAGCGFQDLPFGGQLLVWGMRHWVTALKSGQDFAAMTGDGFAQFGLADAGQSLDDLFQMIAVSAARQIDIRCVKCQRVSPDEQLLLDCLAAAQDGDLPLGYAGLLEILPPAAARHAMPTLISLAKITAHVGLVLRAVQKVPPQTSISPATETPAMETGTTIHHGKVAVTSLFDRAAQKLPHLEVPALVH